MSDSESKSWMSTLGWGCLILVVIAVLGIGSCVAYLYRSGSDAKGVAEAYLAAVDGGDYEAAFELLGPAFTEDRGVADFVAFEQEARAELGSCGGWAVIGTSFNRDNGRAVALLTFRGTCDDEATTVAFNIENVADEWLIQDIRYNELLGPVLQICDDCGAVVPPGARFCPSCGAAVEGDEGGAEGHEAPAGTDG